MPTSELWSSLGTPPLSVICSCGKQMELVSVDPCVTSIIYTYRCTSEHRHEIIMINK
jgi:hypothetical protein